MSFLTLLWIGEEGKGKLSKRTSKEQKGCRVEPIGKKKREWYGRGSNNYASLARRCQQCF